MKLNLRYFGDPILRQKGKLIEEITDEILELVKNMEDTMHDALGIGIAAPQVGHSLALFLTAAPEENSESPPPPVRVFINPKILSYSEESCNYNEGCLSIPNIREDVIRPCTIKIEASGLDGNRFQEELTGLAARVFMHENDHINGVLFIDRISKSRRKAIEPQLKKIKSKYHNK